MATGFSRIALSAAALGAALALSACGNSENITRTFGLTRDAPDEFRVTTRAPLSMPPDYTLSPPQPGEPRPQERSDAQQAELALVPDTALATSTAAPTSPGQAALVQMAGPAAPADIRAQVDEEAAAEANNRSLTQRLLFWRKPPPPGIVVDPAKESERLRTNAALGRNENIGDTPIIQPKTTNIWSNWF